MTIVLSYGGTSVDVSTAEMDYNRQARAGTLPVGNRYADVTQAFGTRGFSISFRNGAFVGYDPRSTLWAWQKNNTPVVLTISPPDTDDPSGRTYLIRNFHPKLVPGIPSSIIIYFELDLTEVA